MSSTTRERRWTNQYIELLDALPQHIITCRGNKMSPPEEELLRSKLASFASVAVELGCGSGAHLIELASRSPERLFIGFELRFKRVYKTAEKADRLGLPNVLVVHADARDLSPFFARGSLSQLYVNFPDPWSKRRWEKHRLLSAESLARFAEFMTADGELRYKTDHREYFHSTLAALQASPIWSVQFHTEDLYATPQLAENIPTEFEKLFRSKNLPIYMLSAKRVGHVSGAPV